MSQEKKKVKIENHISTIYRNFTFYFLLFIFYFLLSPVSAQYRFDSFTTDNGLPQNGVRGIAQTRDGYLWFTTFDGLVRFDGLRFTVFDKNSSSGISSNRFAMLRAEPDGTLFAATEEDGLTVYQNGIFKTYSLADGLPSNAIEFFRTDGKGEFYIVTSAGNYYFRDGKFIPVPDREISEEKLFYRTPTGNFWTYGKDGIKQITPDGREIFYPVKLNYVNERFTGIKLFEDGQGNLWFGDLSGVYRLKDGNIRHFTDKDGVPAKIILRPFLEADDGAVWFASGYYGYTEKVGLVRFHEERFTIWGESAGLSNSDIHNLFKDREGTIWAATDRGLNRVRKQLIQSFSTADGLAHNEVYPLLQSRGGDIYIGTTRGLNRYREGKFSTVAARNNINNYLAVSALHEDAKGQIWIGDADGLYRLENDRLREVGNFNETTIWAIESDTDGNIWIGTAKGLYIFGKDEKLVRHLTVKDGLPSDDVKVIHQDRKGGLWVGTYGGLVLLEREKNNNSQDISFSPLLPFSSSVLLPGSRVRSIYEEADGVIWIGTYDGGLARFKDGKFFNFTVENGLFNNGAFQILEDEKQNFWISSNRGIYRVSKQELNDLADGKITKINSVAYGKQDGMLSTECNGGRSPAGFKAADGRLWFPTQDGVAVFNPNEVSSNPNPPPVKIESVLVERRNVDLNKEITLTADRDNLEIRYTGISFIKPEQIKFRYRIEGFDENWNDVGTIREIYFPSLPAGEYTFRVIAANSDGVWNTDGASLKILVNAPFWKKSWFIALATLAVILTIILIFRLRERELKRRQLVQQEFSRKLLESQEQERKRIASEMHDSLGQYLLAIKNWAMFGLNSLPEKDAAREFLTEVSETSSLAIEEVREIAHNLRPYQLERLGLTNTLEYMMKNIKASSKINFTTEITNIDGFLSKHDEIIFYRIAQECLNNIIKHSNAENAWLNIKSNENFIEFICRDDGKGFDLATAENSAESGLGLSGITERVKILKGELKIDSEISKGTSVSVIIERRND